MKRVLFVCVHNAGRSQMAEAFLRRLGADVAIAESAGTEGGATLNPTVVEAMSEIGYDMSGHRPKLLTPEMAQAADRVITMGCGVDAKSCPALRMECEDWGLEDPKGRPLEEVRRIRDEVRARVEKLVEELRRCDA